MEFERKINRLTQGLYRHQRLYFLTLCCHQGRSAFKNPRVVDWALEKLKLCCENSGFKNHAYCFMPDHLHLLLEGQEGSDLIGMVKQFKQLTGYHFKRETGEKLWQKSFYDHILRRNEDVRGVVRYILENPIRKGLAGQPGEYPFCGSLEFGDEIFNM